MIERYGLGPARIEPAFRETYLALCARARLEPDPATADALAALADGVAEPPPPLDGAIQALARLAERWPTALYTQAGEPEHQRRCIRASGVLDVLPESRVHICERKTPAAYRATLERFGVRDAARSWMVGNSVQSDINPALTVGANAILVEAVEPWIGDIADPVSEDFMRFPDFPAAVEFLDGSPASPTGGVAPSAPRPRTPWTSESRLFLAVGRGPCEVGCMEADLDFGFGIRDLTQRDPQFPTPNPESTNPESRH